MSFLNQVSSETIVDFTKNLAVMIKSGVPINEALGFLEEQEKSTQFKKTISSIKKEIEQGNSLSEAFSKKEKNFGKIFIGLLKSGEASGTLEENLFFLSDWLERNNDLKRDVGAATVYPKIVLAAAFILGGGLAVFILPQLIPLFETLRVELPFTTRMLISISVFVRNYWPLSLFLIILSFILLSFLLKIKFIKRFFHFLSIKLPFVGGFIIYYQLALICQLFATLFRSGLSIQDTLSVASEAVTNIKYQESIIKLKTRAERGISLSKGLEEFKDLYPKNLISIVSVGEKSGTISESFLYLADFYSKEIKNKIKKLPSIIEPVLLIFIGLVVGFIALSIIMPIYELTRGMGY